ncbi:prepilin-type N-terminal cleavage/methylation domain-containing protein [Clostridium neuense]|uniref:Prepilin-type N-terminal cleavage/methylation domain-containing protein n=1 Tax=Clostridium neuense TaxID=1728934 RepID=A0ABW8TJ37_9CLOT
MIKVKREGFTIIEIIAAIAIFAISSSIIVFTIDASAKIYKRENVKFSTSSAVNSLIQQLKAKGVGSPTTGGAINSIADIYALNRKGYVIYFNYEDLPKTLEDTSTYIRGIDEYNPSFEDIKNYKDKISSKKYAAYMEIKREVNKNLNKPDSLNIQWFYNYYTVEIKVWDMDAGSNSIASSSTSVSR